MDKLYLQLLASANITITVTIKILHFFMLMCNFVIKEKFIYAFNVMLNEFR